MNDLTPQSMFSRHFAAPLMVVLLGLCASAANAVPISATLPDVSSNNGSIGDFMFSVPSGHVVTSAIISGAFGHGLFMSSGALTLSLDGFLVATCVKNAPCWTGKLGIIEWSHTFTTAELATGFLDDGFGSLSQSVTVGTGTAKLGSLLLSGETTAVSEPATLTLLGALGILGLAFGRRKKAAHR